MKAEYLDILKGSSCYRCGKEFLPDDDVVIVSGYRDFMRLWHKRCLKSNNNKILGEKKEQVEKNE